MILCGLDTQIAPTANRESCECAEVRYIILRCPARADDIRPYGGIGAPALHSFGR